MSKPKAAGKRFRVLVGLNYGDKRAEPNEVVDDLPPRSVKWLLEQDCIEPVKGD